MHQPFIYEMKHLNYEMKHYILKFEIPKFRFIVD